MGSVPPIKIEIKDSCTNCCTGFSCCRPRRQARVITDEEGNFQIRSRSAELSDSIKQTFSEAARQKAVQENLRARQLLHRRISVSPGQHADLLDPESTEPLSHQELHLFLDLIETSLPPSIPVTPLSEKKHRSLPTPPSSYSPRSNNNPLSDIRDS